MGNRVKLFLYFGYLLVFALSLLATLTLPVTETVRNIASLPGIGALLLAVWQLWRDNLRFERDLDLQNKQQDFALGTASHMAEIAYKKHAEFSEEYMKELHRGLQQMHSEGPSVQTGDIGRRLIAIRQKHSAWLTREIEEQLKPFESKLINIGSQEYLLPHLPAGDKRTKTIEEIFKSFETILGINRTAGEDTDISIDKIIERIRTILGIDVLTQLRQKAIHLALERN